MPEWERVKLGQVVESAKRGEVPEVGKPYRQVGVRLWGIGAYEREVIDGGSTKYAQLYQVEAGDLIVNKIWARNGSIAIIKPDLAGCYCSNEFPVFKPLRSHVTPEWLDLVVRWADFWKQCDERSKGTSGQNRIKPDEFLKVEIPLPPLPVQRRIVARVKGLLEKVEEARRLRAEVVAQLDAYSRSVQAASSTRATPVSELVRLKSPDVKVAPNETYHFAGVYSFGRGVFVGQKKQGQDFAYPRLTRLQAGNFTYPKLMAWEGAFGLVPAECDGLVVSTEYPVFEIDNQKILPEVLESYFKNPRVWPDIAGESTGTNARRRRLNPADFLSHQFPLPSKADQVRIAHASQAARQVQRQQKQTQIELDALPSAILAQAFAGAL